MANSKEASLRVMDRRQFLLLAGGTALTLVGAACAPQQPILSTPDRRNLTPIIPAKPTTAPTKIPAPESLDTQIVEKLQNELLNLSRYNGNLREKFLSFWLQGSTPTVDYTKNGQSYLLVFEPAKADPNLPQDLAITGIKVRRANLSTGGSALAIYFAGTYNPSVANDAPKQMQAQLERMNFEHEAIISLASANGVISAGQDLGLSFKHPSEAGPTENDLLAQLNKYIPVIEYCAEAVAEINDYLLTYPILTKDSQGRPLFVKHPSSEKPLPVLGDKIFLEGGLTFIVDQTIGRSLNEISNLDQLVQKYPTLDSIPNSAEYLNQIQQYFRNKTLTR